MLVSEKYSLAKDLLMKACGRLGIWAGLGRYANQYWTRDLSYSLGYFLLFNGKQELLKKHISQLIKRQKRNGQIPILFIENRFRFFFNKAVKSLTDRKISFMLKRFLQGKLWNLTPGTKDSEVNYLSLIFRYATLTGDHDFIGTNFSAISKALLYVESNLLNSDGLVLGGDWRDTMQKELEQKPVLINNVLYWYVLSKMGRTLKSENLKQNIRLLVNDEIGRSGTSYFDPLGVAFAVIYNLIDESQFVEITNAFKKSSCEYGIIATCPHNPLSQEEAQVILRTGGSVVWPFISAYTIIALFKMGSTVFANEQFKILSQLDGFYEWYDPTTGKGYGEKYQLWGASMFMIAEDCIKKQSDLV